MLCVVQRGPLSLDDLLGVNGAHSSNAASGGALPQDAFSSLPPQSFGMGMGASPGAAGESS